MNLGIALVIIIEICETKLLCKLLKSDTMDMENNMVKYSRDKLLEIRKMVEQDFILRQINVKTKKEIRRCKINRRRNRSWKQNKAKTTSARSK